MLENFYANAPDRYDAVEHGELHSAWTLDEERRHELARMQARFADQWLAKRPDPGLRAPWTYFSPGFERPVLKHLARHWPLAYRLGAERAAAAQKRRVATRARP